MRYHPGPTALVQAQGMARYNQCRSYQVVWERGEGAKEKLTS